VYKDVSNFAHPASSLKPKVGYMFRCCFFINVILSDLRQTNYLNIHQTDLYEICTDGRTVAVDDPAEVIFFDPSRDVAMATNSVGKIDLNPPPCSSRDIR